DDGAPLLGDGQIIGVGDHRHPGAAPRHLLPGAGDGGVEARLGLVHRLALALALLDRPPLAFEAVAIGDQAVVPAGRLAAGGVGGLWWIQANTIKSRYWGWRFAGETLGRPGHHPGRLSRQAVNTSL